MIFEIKELLSPDDVATIDGALEAQCFVEGHETVSGAAGNLGSHLRLADSSEAGGRIGERIERIVLGNRMLRALVLPKRFASFQFSRYEAGVAYGDHVDEPIVGLEAGHPMRADFAMSIFLNPAEDYDGGELVLNVRIAPRIVRLGQGDAIVYPANEFHRVEAVTRGVRKAANTWIESLVRGDQRRRVLTDIWTGMDAVAKLTTPDRLHESQAFATLSKARRDLLRLWAES